MALHWLAVLSCACALAALAHGAAVPTTETLVVTKETNDQSSAAPSSTALPVEPTTAEPPPPIKLTSMDVRSEVRMRYAHTAVVANVRNPARVAQEAAFRVLLPDTAFISGFTMILDDKPYKAYVKEKEEAKQIYNEAVSHGLGAAHVATKARDSNHFTVSVNVEPNTTAVFNLTYEELLPRRNGVYNHAVNLHPGELVPSLTVTVHIKESQKITALRVPEVRTGNEVDATEDDAQNTKAVIQRSDDGREATITFKPDLDEQRKLRDIYAEKLKESQAHRRYSFYGYQEDPAPAPEGVLGQFVVQYDVERSDKGEVLVNDGYFVHFFAPTTLPPLSKHVVFVLDTSGSMAERKIVQLREAMQTILSELNKGDYFSLVSFASGVQVHDLNEAAKEPPKTQYYFFDQELPAPVLSPPYQATPENIDKAKVIVSRLLANGGTNIYSALDVATDLIQRGVGWKPTEAPTTSTSTVAASTPGNDAPHAEPQKAENPEKAEKVEEKPTTEVAKAADDKKEEGKTLEPIIIFLTDGDPTVGIVDTKRIISHLTEKNTGPRKASIYALAFGEDADRKFLRKLSLRNEGFMRHIYEAADAALQLRDFYRQVASPLLANVHFVYPKEQIKEGSVTKHKFRTLYAGSEAVVAGRYEGSDFAPLVYGECGVKDDDSLRKRYEVSPPVSRGSEQYLPLERLWAYLTVHQLLDARDAADDEPPKQDADNKDDKEETPVKKALAIALKYSFVTPLTSLVVVKPNATNAVDAESVDKQNEGNGFGVLPLTSNFGLPGLPGPPVNAYPAYPAAAGGFAAQSMFAQGALQPQFDVLAEESDVESADYAEGGVLRLVDRSSLQPLAVVRPAAHSYARFAAPSSFSYSPKRYSAISAHSPPMLGFAAHGIPAMYTDVDSAGAPGQSQYGPPSTRPPLPLPPMSSAPPTPPPPSPLGPYHLQLCPWVEELKEKDTDSIVVPVNGTKLELTKDTEAPRESGGDAECAHATDGAGGVCVYLTRCVAARAATAADYANTFCAVNNKYAGICCPKSEVDAPQN